MVVGMMVSPLVLSTRNIIIGLVAVSFLGLSACSWAMAFSPVGVAALSSPSMFDAMFMNMLPMAGWFLGISGKSLVKTGLNNRAKALTAPAFSPIFMIPNHSAKTPVKPKEVSRSEEHTSELQSRQYLVCR